MKKIFNLIYLLLSFAIYGQVNVKGYYRSNGTYVAPHTRSSPNSTVTDNYSYTGRTSSYSTNTPSTSTNTIYSKKSTSDVWVDGYYRSDGTYVNGYYRSSTNNNSNDNISYQKNADSYNKKVTSVNSDTSLKSYSEYSNKTYYVTSKTLKLRAGPTFGFPVIKTLEYGNIVKFVETTDKDWAMVLSDSQLGYVSSKHISNSELENHDNTKNFNPVLVPSSTNIKDYNFFKVNVSSIDIRKDPNWSGIIFATFSYGDIIETIGEYDENWTIVRLKYEGSKNYRIGYIQNNLLNK